MQHELFPPFIKHFGKRQEIIEITIINYEKNTSIPIMIITILCITNSKMYVHD